MVWIQPIACCILLDVALSDVLHRVLLKALKRTDLADNKGSVCGIGLLESIHKLNTVIIKLSVSVVVEFFLLVHGLWRQRGCFTAIGEAKLWMQHAECWGVTVYQVFLDLKKAYNLIS